MRRDQAVLIAALAVFGALSAWLLPDGWRLASLPVALICATVARRYAAGARHGDTGDEGRGTAMSDSNDPSWYGVCLAPRRKAPRCSR